MIKIIIQGLTTNDLKEVQTFKINKKVRGRFKGNDSQSSIVLKLCRSIFLTFIFQWENKSRRGLGIFRVAVLGL